MEDDASDVWAGMVRLVSPDDPPRELIGCIRLWRSAIGTLSLTITTLDHAHGATFAVDDAGTLTALLFPVAPAADDPGPPCL